MLRREFSGAVVATTLAANITNGSTTITALDASTFPTGDSGNPFVIIIDRGANNEEKILVTSRSSNSFSVSQRGYDGTTANSHTAGASIDHVLDATTVQDMNTTTYDNEINIWMAV